MECTAEYTAWVLEWLIAVGMIIALCAAAVLINRMLFIHDRERREVRRGIMLQTRER